MMGSHTRLIWLKHRLNRLLIFRTEAVPVSEYPSYVDELHNRNNMKFSDAFRVSLPVNLWRFNLHFNILGYVYVVGIFCGSRFIKVKRMQMLSNNKIFISFIE